MTSRQAAALLGTVVPMRVDLTSGVMTVLVTILDFRQAFGRTDALVTPLSGSTTGDEGVWVSLDRIDLTDA